MQRSMTVGGRCVIAVLVFVQTSYSTEYNCPRFTPGRHLHVPEFQSSKDATFPEETTISFKCDPAYRLHGVPNLLCLDGMWYGSIPTCEPLVNCTEPGFERGGYTGECCTPGDEVKFHCFNDQRFQLSGARSATCLEDGSWNETIPTCEDTYCNDPGLSANSDRLLMWDNTPYTGDVCCPPETTAVYSCHKGYELDGVPSLRCRENGTWTFPVPKCRKQTCARFEPGAHLTVEEFQATTITNFTEGTEINFRCEAGYLLQGDFSAICRTGAWSTRIPYCEQIRCAPLRSPMHGWMSGGSSTAIGAIAKFGCADGYRLLGTEERRCHSNGLWNGMSVRCMPETIFSDPTRSSCTDAGDPDNGYQKRETLSSVLGTFVLFKCYPGYHMLGSPIVLCDSLLQLQSRPLCVSKFFFMHGSDVRPIIQKKLHSFHALPQSLEEEGNLPQPLARLSLGPVRHVVLFLLEASTAIGAKNFRKKLNLVRAMIRQLTLISHNRVGVIHCDMEATLVVDPANFNSTVFSLDTFDSALHNLSPGEGGCMKAAITKLGDTIETTKIKFGENVEIVVFFFTDVKLNLGGGAYESARRLARKHALEMYSIGIAGRTDKAALEEFSSLFAKHRVLILRNHDALQWLADVISAGYNSCGVTAPTPLEKLLEGIYDYSFTIAKDNYRLRSWPWLVTISTAEKSSLCGGSIISSKWIMTSGRCVSHDTSGNVFSPTDLLVQAKISCPENTSVIQQCSLTNLSVKRIYRHEEYHHVNFFNDISLLELTHEIKYDEFLRPVCLPAAKGSTGADPSLYEPGKEALVVSPEPRALYNLRQMKMAIGSELFCADKGGKGNVAPGMMCAQYEDDEGDNAGAALMQASGEEETAWTQVGISSWVQPKKNNSVRFFADVSYYLPWIRRHLDVSG